MKFVLIGLLAALATTKWIPGDDCPEAKQISCVDDTRAAYEPCKKAAETGGADMAADLNCMKYFTKMKSDCWPCICAIAHKEKWQVKGC
jgi:hypothetical protein